MYNENRFCKRNDCILTLRIKEIYINKEYNLYTICKVVDNKIIPLYDETFTDKQLDSFYDNPVKHTHSIDICLDNDLN